MCSSDLGTQPEFSTAGLFAGDQVHAVATPFDGLEDGAAVTSPVALVNNTPPVTTAVSLRPTAPTTTQTIVASATASDADGHPVTFTYAFAINGTEVQRSTSPNLAPALTTKRDSVTVTAIPNDGYADGTPLASAPVVVVNSAPTLAGATLGPTQIGRAHV